ncbi:bifunctional 2-polyprenyl-6-hydroxyphenol methylase/3-demethylubiquinol 3-O-methyltransferase UbiG [Candidatus Deianiraea vastatrix]|uniref:Ubiquinone biosynthesis O-methyltransferase n=1 Tax=Candidatus Deianiraea vastatrix TaxID=2163644 RepID=A0A5B8XEH7_9RICK|nr:bifunctional 2-polyprenyl-6-hydroxyphenol methylase/3-demethylubiquinol 3-O-methyltransferase UbiG [Candidatus Deianiraea vastatrix]QED23673.1 Ubiquinone biosynthesis O-methyltransferase [Candidatus Deianiraea vastatrix]
MSEAQKFSQYSHNWWDENGDMKMLHKINPIRVQYIQNIIEKYSNNAGNLDILDLGCGCGILSESLAKLGHNVVGIDASESNVETAKNHANIGKIDNIHYATNLVNCNKKFDVITIMEVLEHVDNLGEFLHENLKFAKEKSIVIISTINRNLASILLAKFAAEYILNIVPKGTHSIEKFLTPYQVNEKMEANNFKNVDICGLKYNPLKSEFSLIKSPKINYFMSFVTQNVG